MKIRKQQLPGKQIPISTMETPHGYHDYLCSGTGEKYRVPIQSEADDDPWLSIALDPMIYPEETVSMTYE